MTNRSTAASLKSLCAVSSTEEPEEVAELRERVAELEKDLDRCQRPWTLQSDFSDGQHGGGSTGRRRGISKINELLDALEVKEAARFLAENTTGATAIGSLILVIEHLGALAFNKKFNELDMAIDELRERLFKDCGETWREGLDALRVETSTSLHRMINDNATEEIARAAEDLARHNRERGGRHA